MSRKKVQISELDLNKIGGRIAYIRLSNDENQDVFAIKTGLSKSNVSGLENHKYEPSFKALVQISEIYSVNANWLLFGKGDIFINEDNVSNKNVIPYENAIDAQHMSLIKQFENKELALELNSDLIKLEKLDVESLYEINDLIKLKIKRKSKSKQKDKKEIKGA